VNLLERNYLTEVVYCTLLFYFLMNLGLMNSLLSEIALLNAQKLEQLVFHNVLE